MRRVSKWNLHPQHLLPSTPPPGMPPQYSLSLIPSTMIFPFSSTLTLTSPPPLVHSHLLSTPPPRSSLVFHLSTSILPFYPHLHNDLPVSLHIYSHFPSTSRPLSPFLHSSMALTCPLTSPRAPSPLLHSPTGVQDLPGHGVTCA